MKTKYQNEVVKHSYNCCNVDCLISGRKHVSCFYFLCVGVSYVAESITEAAKMWASDGQKDIVEAGRIG